MPAVVLAHPITLAALAIFAIGFISYTIIKSRKEEITVRKRRNYRERCIKYNKEHESAVCERSNDDLETMSCSSIADSDLSENNYPGLRQRHNANSKIKKTDSITKSSTYSNKNIPHVLSNNLDSFDQNKYENNKIQNIDQNIRVEHILKPDVTRTVLDDYAESSISNASTSDVNSVKSGKLELINSEEKSHNKKVCEYLENDLETKSCSSIADSAENNDREYMLNLMDSDNAEENTVCKACEECYANAVSYPCRHRYLCIDCAIKVHRIFSKCTVCNTKIETYDIYTGI